MVNELRSRLRQVLRTVEATPTIDLRPILQQITSIAQSLDALEKKVDRIESRPKRKHTIAKYTIDGDPKEIVSEEV
jgi:hypothetical protein